MEIIRSLPDGAFDLAIVDPPYGINAGAVRKYCTKNAKVYAPKQWDASTPDAEYFMELRRVSRNQIIWGGNYYASKLPDSRGWIFWDKRKQVENYADGELAWTSYDRNLKKVTLQHHGFLTADDCGSIHPTQKPVALYEWILRNYAEYGCSILDTHMGSGSSVIAALRHGFQITACEIDPDYFNGACERIPNEISQGMLFEGDSLTKGSESSKHNMEREIDGELL